MEQWNGFKGTKWKEGVDTRDFIQNNYTEYRGDDSFLEGPTEATEKLWDELQKLNDIQFERNGVYDMDTEIVSTITSHDAGYLDKDLEKIVG
ncbi:TPA: formate acetyltransferase, partial [Enterococcus faecium]|nr:formate acetyltransferase [Enterococcus faecium]